MKLTPAQVRQVQRGEKTEHRILIVGPHEVRRPPAQGKLGRANPRTGESATYTTETRKPQIGDSLVIRSYQPATETSDEVEEVRVQVTGVRRDTLQNLTTATVNAEGYRGDTALSDFMHAWMVRHDPGYPPNAEALCLVCEGHKHYENHDGETIECDQCDEVGTIQIPARPTREQVITRFERRHAHHLVYVVAFTHQADVSQWLHRRPGHPPTTSIGEALDPDAPLLGPPSKQWREKSEQRRRDALRDRDGARLAGLDTLHAAYQAELLRLAVETDTHEQVRGAAHTVRQQHERARQRLTDDDQDRRAA